MVILETATAGTAIAGRLGLQTRTGANDEAASALAPNLGRRAQKLLPGPVLMHFLLGLFILVRVYICMHTYTDYKAQKGTSAEGPGKHSGFRSCITQLVEHE